MPPKLMFSGLVVSRLLRLVALPRARKALLLKCTLALLRATWQVRVWPFSRLAASLGAASSPTSSPISTPTSALASASPTLTQSTTDLAHAQAIRWAVSAWSKAWPRPPTCLIQAVAARQLLVACGASCQLYLGVRSQSGGQERAAQNIGAHAWLCCADIIVTGDAEAANFQPIAVYRFCPFATAVST